MEALGLIASFLNLALKMAHWNEAPSHPSWEPAALELTLRFVIVGLILSAYLRLRNLSQLPLSITRQSALLTTDAVQSILLAIIALYALVAERISGLTEPVPFLPAWGLSALALGTVIAGLILRRRFLFFANEKLRHDPHDVDGLGQWRRITILSMFLAESIGLYGFFLRAGGGARTVAWLFIFASVVMLFVWGPTWMLRKTSSS